MYLHNEPMKADYSRRHNNIKNVRTLLLESNNICPLCHKTILDNVENEEEYIGNIAHIYARSNFYKHYSNGDLKEMFPNEYHISSPKQLDNVVNLILLCEKCHKNYDKLENINYNSYLELLAVKKKQIMSLDTHRRLYIAVLQLSNTLDKIEKAEFTNIKRTKLIKKVEKNEIKYERLHRWIIDYNIDHFSYLDESEIIPEMILKAIGQCYIDLRNIYEDKNELLSSMCNTLSKKDIYNFEEEIRIILAYCIMKCEVLDE